MIEWKKTLLILVAGTSTSACDLLKDRPVGLGYSAKYICSYVFNSGIDEQVVIDQFVAPKVKPLPLVWGIDVDHDRQQVRVWDVIFGQRFAAQAFYTPGKGCTLLVDQSREDVAAIPFTPAASPQLDPAQPWPYGGGGKPAAPVEGVDYPRVENAVAAAFAEVHAVPVNTTSVLVAYRGQLIAEQYGMGANVNTPLLGWSMTKTITGMLAGILVDQGRMEMDAPAPIARWQGTDRESITTRNLLNMAAGLKVNEDYARLSDVTQMLYLESDQYDYALKQPVVHAPGEMFQYSTAEANRLAAAVQEAAGGTQQAMYDFYQAALFHRIDITSAFIEFDATGNFVGGAYGFMTARDWARLGELYLQRGEWNGEQVLSSGFVDFVTQPSPASPLYGGMIWLNTDGNAWPNIPGDAYFFAGHQGQHIVVVPSKNLVVVRTGVTEGRELVRDGIMAPLLAEVIASLPE